MTRTVPDDHVAVTQGRARVRRQRAAGDGPRGAQRDGGVTADGGPGVGRGRAGLAAVAAQHLRALLDKGAGHHITSSAPSLIETETRCRAPLGRADAQLDAGGGAGDLHRAPGRPAVRPRR